MEISRKQKMRRHFKKIVTENEKHPGVEEQPGNREKNSDA